MSDVKHTDKHTETHECVCERTETHGDAVSREDAIEAVRNLQTYKLDERDDMLLVDLADVQTELMMMPSAEPETIVRCKDCKHKYIEEKVWNCPFGLPGGEEFFCSYGARMEGENDG